jgi:NDP-4-keto-2,6-dideoxyhexose 3-C-methyltransferase
MKFIKNKNCRCCGSVNIKKYLNFGNMYLSTAFPKTKKNSLRKIPMVLEICHECKLAQLAHNYELSKLYNENYGYKSGINQSMKNHLKLITREAINYKPLKKNDIVLDIASNDGTLLKNYNKNLIRVGVDPVINKYRKNYKKMKSFETFFSKEIFLKNFKKKKVKIITSIAVFYDVNNPRKFVNDISDIMDPTGIWILEQSYFPHLIKNNAYDSICHEHLTYFTIKQIKMILEKYNLEIFNISSNSMNGGSIRFFIKFKDNKKIKIYKNNIDLFLSVENKFYKNFFNKLSKFKLEIEKSRSNIDKFLKEAAKSNKSIHIYGASTKGNIILQYCKINRSKIKFAADRNPDKFNRYTPGSNIKIISEKESRSMKPDYYLVMPWHFKNEIIKREKIFSKNGGKLIFPLPKFQVL